MLKNFKKVMGISLAVVLAVSSLTGCGEKKDGTITISIGGQMTERTEKNAATYDLFQTNATNFSAENPGVTVVPDNFTFNLSDYMVKAAGGQLPTMFRATPTELKQIVETGYAQDITPLFKKYGYKDALDGNKYSKLYEYDGKVYGIIKQNSLYDMGIAYNIDVFKQADLLDENGLPKFPQTWEELAETAKIIKDKTGKTGFAIATKSNHGGWHLMNIMWAYGADFMKIENGKWKATFASDEGVAALQYIKDLKWKYGVIQAEELADITVGGKLLSLGDAGMIITHMGMLDQYVRKFGMDITNIAMSKLPAGPAGRFSQVGADIYIFTGDEKENEAAFKWLNFTGEGVTQVNDDIIQGWEKTYADKQKNGYLVGVEPKTPYTNSERNKVISEISNKYRTVNEKNFADYMNGEGVEYKFEPERCVQQMYAALDAAIQQVIGDKNADCKAILEKTQADFQANFLDKESVN